MTDTGLVPRQGVLARSCCQGLLDVSPQQFHGVLVHAQVDEEQFKKIMNYIDQGKAEGAKLNCGGKRKGDKGFYVEPTVFSEVPSPAGLAVDVSRYA